MSSWISTDLEQIADFFSGGTPRKSESQFWNGGDIPWISGSSMHSMRVSSSEKMVTPEAIGKGTRIAQTGATLVLVRGMSLLDEIRIGHAIRDVAFNQDVKALVAKPGVNAWFLTYALQGRERELLAAVHLAGHGTGVLATERLKKLRVLLPPIEEQRQIVGVLGRLDDLIDLNETLLKAQTALVDSEFERQFGQKDLALPLGELGDVVDCLHSKKPERVEEGNRLLLQLNNIRDDGLLETSDRYYISDADYVRWSRNFESVPFDIVITNVGRVGAVARIPAGVSAAIGRNMTAIRLRNVPSDAPFVSAALLCSAVRREIVSKTDAGTILNALNVRNIPKLRLPSSSPAERAEFSQWARPLLEASDSLLAHSQELRRVRDELLPLLMSGRIRVGNIAGVEGD